jgi:hypothetical protein
VVMTPSERRHKVAWKTTPSSLSTDRTKTEAPLEIKVAKSYGQWNELISVSVFAVYFVVNCKRKTTVIA